MREKVAKSEYPGLVRGSLVLKGVWSRGDWYLMRWYKCIVAQIFLFEVQFFGHGTLASLVTGDEADEGHDQHRDRHQRD